MLIGVGFGRANDRVARLQETYVADATTTWLESLERSLAMMKEYQVHTLEMVTQMGTNCCRLLARSSRTADWRTTPPFPRCKRPRRRTSE